MYLIYFLFSQGTCDAIYFYYDWQGQSCLAKVGENIQCTNTTQCLGDLSCTVLNICQCGTNQYFDSSLLKCFNKQLESGSCTTNINCRTDLGLSCSSSLCKCDSSIKFWSASQLTCLNLITYGNNGCNSDSQCEPNKNLFCNLNAAANKCDCPTSSVNGMCDCIRTSGNENYWNGISCVPSLAYGSSCSNNYTCRSLTDLTFCRSGVCSLLINGDSCTSSPQCDGSKLLSCVLNKCSCGSNYYWDSTAVNCGNN